MHLRLLVQICRLGKAAVTKTFIKTPLFRSKYLPLPLFDYFASSESIGTNPDLKSPDTIITVVNMASTGDSFTLDKFDHRKYDFNNSDSTQKILVLAKDFTKWLRSGRANDVDSVRPKIDAFVGLITAGSDPLFARQIFEQVAFMVPELRLNQSIIEHRIGAMKHLLYMTQHYRPAAPLAELPETVYFSRSVSRQLQSFVMTQQSNQIETDMMQAAMKAVSPMPRSSSSTRARPSDVGSPTGVRSPTGVSSPPGMTSPSGYQSQVPASRHIRRESGTASRADEAQTGSLEELRSRRRSSIVQGSQPFSPSRDQDLTEGMQKMSLLPPFGAGSTHNVTPSRSQAAMSATGPGSVSRLATPLTTSGGARPSGSQPASPNRTPPGATPSRNLPTSSPATPQQQRGRSTSAARQPAARSLSRSEEERGRAGARESSQTRGRTGATFPPSSMRAPSAMPGRDRSASRPPQQLSRPPSVAPSSGRPPCIAPPPSRPQSQARGRAESSSSTTRQPSAQPAARRTSSKAPPQEQSSIKSFFGKK